MIDVIIGNPPYQLNIGHKGRNKSKAKSIYNLFMQKGFEVSNNLVSMIVPSRWFTQKCEGINEQWVKDTLDSNKFIAIHDFKDASDIFNNVIIEGGVNYFIYSSNHNSVCDYFIDGKTSRRYLRGSGFIIRSITGKTIYDKILKSGDISKINFSNIVSPKDLFTTKTSLTSSWDKFTLEKTNQDDIKYYYNKRLNKSGEGWINKDDLKKNIELIHNNKILISASYGISINNNVVLNKPFLVSGNSCCSQTYLVIGYQNNYSIDECKNIISYIKTKFFRYMVSILKTTQQGARSVYKLVPLQDFSKPWQDHELYKMYGLTNEEIDHIEKTIRVMP